VQVYVDGVLKGFSTVEIQPSKIKTVSIVLDRTAFSRWNANGNSKIGTSGVWKIAYGDYKIDVRKDAHTVLMGGTWTIDESQACEWEGL
jgi:hypothetical protein